MKNKVLMAMGIGIAAALAPAALTSVDAKADDFGTPDEILDNLVIDNQSQTDPVSLTEADIETDINGDDDITDKFTVINDREAWEQVDPSKISDDESEFENAVKVAEVTVTESFTGYVDVPPKSPDETDEDYQNSIDEFVDEQKTELENEGYTILSTEIKDFTDLEAIDGENALKFDNKTSADKAAEDLNDMGYSATVSVDVDKLNELKDQYNVDADDPTKYNLEEGFVVVNYSSAPTSSTIVTVFLTKEPAVGDKVYDKDHNEYTISAIEDLVKNGTTVKKLTFRNSFGNLSNGTSTIMLDYYSIGVVEMKTTVTASLKPDLGQNYTPDADSAVININNLEDYNIIAFNSLTNNGQTNGSVMVGGSYSGEGTVINKPATGNCGDSYLADPDAIDSSKFLHGKANGKTEMPKSITSDEVDATKKYWETYADLLLAANLQGLKALPDSFVEFVDLDQLAVNGAVTIDGTDITGNGSPSNGGKGQAKHIYVSNSNLNITVTGLMGIVLAPNSDITINVPVNTDSSGKGKGNSSANSYGGVVIGNNIINNSLGKVNKLDDFKPVYGTKTIGSATGLFTVESGGLQAFYAFKVTAPAVTHKEYVITAEKVYKEYFGEKLPDNPVTPPPYNPPGGGGDDIIPTTPPGGPGPGATDVASVATDVSVDVAVAPAPAAPAAVEGPAVLGARRSSEQVLGAKRSVDQAVLGARRSPKTGDTMSIFGWIGALTTSLSGAGFAARSLKKKENEEE